MSSEHAVENEQIFTGADFTDARVLLGVSLEQLSRELRLPIRTLEAIEAGRLEGLGGPVFVRGYIRAYARRLRLDPERYVVAFDHAVGAAGGAPVRAVGTVSTSPARQSRFLMRFGSFVFIAGILATVVWWWQTQYSLEGLLSPQNDAPVTVETADGNTLVLPTLSDPLPSEAPASVAQSSAGQGVETAQGSTTAIAPVEQAPALVSVELPAVGMPAAPVAASAENAEVEAESAEAAVEEAEAAPVKGLQLGLSEDSWLSVKDARGTSLFNGIAKAGSDLTFEGAEPLTVVIGRADAVTRIQYAGQPVDITAVSSKNVARLKLPQ